MKIKTLFLFGVKKEQKNLWGGTDPKPQRPWQAGTLCQTRSPQMSFRGAKRHGIQNRAALQDVAGVNKKQQTRVL